MRAAMQRAREIQERLKNDPEFAAIVMAEGIRRGIITPSRDEDAVTKDPNITTEEW